MSFYPRIGTSSTDNFSSSDGAVFSDTTKQAITGGYVSLLPQVNNTYSYIGTWEPFTGWAYNNRLFSRAVITGGFNLISRQENFPPPISGYQRSALSAGAWEIYTPLPILSGAVWSGATAQGIQLSSNSPYNAFGIFLEEQEGSTFTIEVDVASLESPYTTLPGFATGQENLTGMTPLSGVVGHGIYLRTASYWDHLEVLPYGIRSITHPEIAIPVDFTTPRRIRVGVQNQDIYIVSEDGHSVAGLGKFNNPTSQISANIILGAPYITGVQVDFTGISVSGFAGHTFWSNFKISTGTLVLQTSPEVQQYYPTTSAYMYTDEFDPTIGITQYVSAVIGFIPYSGGSTVVEVEYSGVNGFTGAGTSVTLNGAQRSPYSLDLTSIPVYSYPRIDNGIEAVSNPLRFKVTQSSSNGRHPSPAIDYITVTAASEKAYLDLIPDWKPINRGINLKVRVESGQFLLEDPASSLWNNLLINVPDTIGRVTGKVLADQSRFSRVVEVNGDGEIQYGGPFGYCYQTYVYTSGTPVQNSELASLLGNDSLYNFYPDPFFKEDFKPVINEPNYITGKLFGEIGKYAYIPSSYTGRAPVEYQAISVSRPELESRANQIALLNGLPTEDFGYLQSVTVPAIPSSSTIHDGTIGIEFNVPSGIQNNHLTVGVDLHVPYGTGIQVYITGAGSNRSWYLNGEDFRVFRKVEFPVTISDPYPFRIGFVVPSGSRVSDLHSYSIDNLTVSPIATSYIQVTGFSGSLHHSGVITNPSVSASAVKRAATIFSSSIYLDSYPVSTGVLVNIQSDAASKGFQVAVDNNGYLIGWADMQSESFGSDAGTPFTDDYGRIYFRSEHKVPLGRWTNVGFNHQASTYDRLGVIGFSGGTTTSHFASTNKLVLTIDGYPTCVQDAMSGWWLRNSISDSDNINTPVLTYIPISQESKAVLFSGIYGKVDAITVSRPAYSDSEVELSIKGARVTHPYFVPDVFYKPGTTGNVLFNTGWDTTYGSDIYLGSCYNFYGPGYTYWDHGKWGNHLIPNGTPLKDSTLSPYSGFGSTRFISGSYATAKYSSSADRLINPTGTHLSSYDSNFNYKLNVNGWVYPRSTGIFFHMLEDENDDSYKITLGVNSSNRLELKRDTTDIPALWNALGNTLTISGWNWIGFTLELGDYPSEGSASVVHYGLYTHTGYLISGSVNDIDAGFRYRGRTGDTAQSAFKFGGVDANLCDWTISLLPINYNHTTHPYYSGNKGGRYQTLLNGTGIVTGVTCNSFQELRVNLPPITTPETKSLFVAGANAYDNVPKLNGGFLLYPDIPFREVQSYHLKYDTSVLHNAFGNTDSPIRIGYVVPDSAINIARIESPEFTTQASVSAVNLSYTNVNNISTFKDGEYTISRNGGAITSSIVTGLYNGIYTTNMSGRADVVYKGAIDSDNVEISTLAITSPDLDVAYPAYYAYLLGRGEFGVKVPSANPHYTGEILQYTTGVLLNTYRDNLTKLRNSIVLKDSEGNEVSIDQYPFDVVYSVHNTSDLLTAAYTGIDINLDGIGIVSGKYSPILPDTIFSVILLANKKIVRPDTSVWAHFTSYLYADGTIDPYHKEIVNPIPIYRENQNYELPDIGRYSIYRNQLDSKTYDIVLYGIGSGQSGSL